MQKETQLLWKDLYSQTLTSAEISERGVWYIGMVWECWAVENLVDYSYWSCDVWAL